MREMACALLLFGLGVLPASGQSTCQELPGSSPQPGGQLGCSVNLRNGLLALGAHLDGAGSITPCRRRTDGTWMCESPVRPADGRTGDQFGRSVAVDEEWLIVGAPFAGGSGVVYVYRRIGGAWVQSQKLTASDGAQGDQFGITLALGGDTLIVGASNHTGTAGSLAGAVYVFHRTGETWTQQQKLTAGGAAPFDNFGFSLAIDGSIVVVGAPFQDGVAGNSGAAYVFERNGDGVWNQRARLTASDGAADDEYGSAVAVSGNALAVGARTDDVNGKRDAGSAYVYERRDTGGWDEVARFFGEAAEDRFGAAASMSGDRLLIGALLHDGSDGPDSGAAYLFARSRATSRWEPESLPALVVPKAHDRFGQAVSVHEKDLLVGAYLAKDGAGSATVCRDPEPHSFTVVKSDGRKDVLPGDTLTYSILVTNIGTRAASAVQVTDTFSAKLRDVSWCVPGGQPDCAHPRAGNINQIISLAPQDSVRFTATATVKLNASGMITNEACVQAPGEPKSCGHDDPPDRIVPVPECTTPVALQLVKSGPASAKPGQRITYTLTATNQGRCKATRVRLEDRIPAGLQAVAGTLPGGCSVLAGTVVCDLPDIAFGGSDTVALQFDVLQACNPAVVNTATVSSAEQGPVVSNAVSTDIARVADVTLTKTGPAAVKPGDPIPYTLTVTNQGPDIACGVVVSDPIPAGLASPGFTPPCEVRENEIHCVIGELSAGTSYVLPVSFTATPAAACTPIVNQATVSAVPPDADPQPANDSETVTTSIAPDLSIRKTDGLATASPGQTLLYTIAVSNPGGSPATVTDVFPFGLTHLRWCRDAGELPCTPSRVGDLQDVLADSTATYRVQGTVAPMFTGTIANTASVTGAPGCVDPDPGNNSATDMTEIVLAPGVTVLCKGIAGVQAEGGMVTYTFLLLNGGPAAQMDNPGAEFTDLLPTGLTLVSASASSGTVTLGNPVIWNGAIPVGGMVTITITATISLGSQAICNTPRIAFDRDGDGINESIGTVAAPCCIPSSAQIPALSGAALGVLALLLGIAALRRLRSPIRGR